MKSRACAKYRSICRIWSGRVTFSAFVPFCPRNPFARLSCAARSPRARCGRQPRVRAVNAAPALTPTPTPSASAAIGARHVFKAAVDVTATPCRGDATRLELRVGARPPRPARSRGLGRARDRERELVRLRRVGTGSFRRLGARAQTRSSSRSVWSSAAGFARVSARNARAARAASVASTAGIARSVAASRRDLATYSEHREACYSSPKKYQPAS